MQSSVLYCEKDNSYLNVKEKNLDICFRIAWIVIQRSLQMEFANMFFSSFNLNLNKTYLRHHTIYISYLKQKSQGRKLRRKGANIAFCITVAVIVAYAPNSLGRNIYCWVVLDFVAFTETTNEWNLTSNHLNLHLSSV